MTLVEKIPDMTDDEVGNLLANARRLSESDDPKRKAQAAELLPALETAATERRSARLAAAALKRAAKRPRKAAA